VSAGTTNASTFIGANFAPSAVNLHQTYVQEFGDTSEPVELRVDATPGPRLSESVTVALLKSVRLEMLRTIWASTKPSAVLTLKPGEIRRISDRLIVEKTADGRILLYEVID